MKTKIGLVTFYKDNLGSILQCYATKMMVERSGYECDVLFETGIPLKGENVLIKKARRIITLSANFISDPSFYIRWKKNRKMPFPLSRGTWDKMDQFVDEYIKPKGLTWDEMVESQGSYAAFIAGSDQIWNAYNEISPMFFLKFTTAHKRIAFAVSFGIDDPSKKFLSTIKSGVQGFSKISVREESGIDIIKKVTDVSVKRIADPTLMLNKQAWMEFCRDISIAKKEYILVHFLDSPNDIAIKYIKSIKGNRRVLCIAYKYHIFQECGWDFLDCGPKEYVAYINGAKYVCTDSFHTTLFSINLGIDFFTFERQYLHGHPQTSRITDLLRRYDLLDRFIKDTWQINDSITDIARCLSMIDKERQITRDYLINEIEGRIGIV